MIFSKSSADQTAVATQENEKTDNRNAYGVAKIMYKFQA